MAVMQHSAIQSGVSDSQRIQKSSMIQTGPAPVKSPIDHTGPKWVLPPVPCTQEDCGFVCRHSDLLPFGCPGVNCYCLQNP
ncbi:hypothetical protein Bca101_032720 [Brassica carinata]